MVAEVSGLLTGCVTVLGFEVDCVLGPAVEPVKGTPGSSEVVFVCGLEDRVSVTALVMEAAVAGTVVVLPGGVLEGPGVVREVEKCDLLTTPTLFAVAEDVVIWGLLGNIELLLEMSLVISV